jgi:uncharacterized protein involved in exopolysaccharide biosynthesis
LIPRAGDRRRAGRPGDRRPARQRIRERAARAGPQIQLVVALVLVLSVLLTIAAVLVTELTATGLGLAP